MYPGGSGFLCGSHNSPAVTVAQGNGKVPTAHARAKALGKQIDAAENTLAVAIGQAVAVQLGQLLQPVIRMLPHVATAAAGQKTGCVYCCGRRKAAEHAHAEAVEALQREYQIACQAAADLGDTPPELTLPTVELPEIQEAFTWVPVHTGHGLAVIPVCYDDLPAPDGEPAGPAFRETGLVTADGRPVVAQAG